VSLYVYLPAWIAWSSARLPRERNPQTVEDQFYGDRSGFLQDPFGHLWGVATHIEDVAPKELEERAKKVTQAA
jgi:PhnB protein